MAQSGSGFLFRCPSLRVVQNLLSKRSLSRSSSVGQWQNETPPGGLTELYVFRPVPARVWPDPVLGPLSPQDPFLTMPGNVGPTSLQTVEKGSDAAAAGAGEGLDVLSADTARERQAQTLHTATDYIQYNNSDRGQFCQDILEKFPELDGMRDLHCQLQEAPLLLRKELSLLFPGRNLNHGYVGVLTMSQKTLNDMTGWSADVEEERERLVYQFVTAAKEICGRLKNEGYWADFVDPTSGKPYFHRNTNTTMFETDEKYRLLGFRIEDLGCCKVITHRDFGRHVFVGTIFTDAHPSHGVIQDMFKEMEVILDGMKKNLDNIGGGAHDGGIIFDDQRSIPIETIELGKSTT